MQIGNNKIFLTTVLTIFYSLVIGLIVISYLAKDEGTLGNNVILNFIADYLFLIATPTFILISTLAKSGLSNIQFFIIAVLISAFTYAILTVLIYSHLRKRKFLHKNGKTKENDVRCHQKR